MICPSCRRETEPSFFCHACDVYLANPLIGRKAGIARRWFALVLDGAAIWVIFFVLIALAGVVGETLVRAVGVRGVGFWEVFILAVVGYTIFALWFLARGKTPGKWLVGIRAANKSDGRFPGLGRMLVRETIGKFVSGFFLGLGYFWAIWDRDAQAWHDKIAGTVVVREVALGPSAFSSARLSEPVSTTTSAGPAALAPAPSAQAQSSAVAGGRLRFCSDCGAQVGSGSSFCEECGARLT